MAATKAQTQLQPGQTSDFVLYRDLSPNRRLASEAYYEQLAVAERELDDQRDAVTQGIPAGHAPDEEEQINDKRQSAHHVLSQEEIDRQSTSAASTSSTPPSDSSSESPDFGVSLPAAPITTDPIDQEKLQKVLQEVFQKLPPIAFEGPFLAAPDAQGGQDYAQIQDYPDDLDDPDDQDYQADDYDRGSQDDQEDPQDAIDGVYVSASLPTPRQARTPEDIGQLTKNLPDPPEDLDLAQSKSSLGDGKRISLPPSGEVNTSQENDLLTLTAAMNRDIMSSLRRLRKLRLEILKQYGVVEEARRVAKKQRRRARLGQKRLLGAQIDPQSRSVVIGADEVVAQLYNEAKLSTRQSRVSDERVEKAEKRLRDLEKRSSKIETDLHAKLDQITLQDDAQDDDEDGSVVSTATNGQAASVASLEDDPTVRAYNHMVSEISILRERLNDFEINHRAALADREDAFEDMIVPAQKGMRDPKWQSTTAKIEFIKEHNRQNKKFLQKYFDTRTAMTQKLLETIEAARALRQQCLDNGLEPEDPDDPNAVEEALQYNLQGTIGSMYAVHHDGSHRGIMPINLIRVPYQHSIDRVEEWLCGIRMVNVNKNVKELDSEAKHPLPARLFEIHYDILKSTERRLNPFLTSATDYRPSHMLETEDEEKVYTKHGVVTIVKEMRHWTAWAGEVYSTESEPDLDRIALGAPQYLSSPPDRPRSHGNETSTRTRPECPKASSDSGYELAPCGSYTRAPLTDNAYIYRAPAEIEYELEVTELLLNSIEVTDLLLNSGKGVSFGDSISGLGPSHRRLHPTRYALRSR